MVYYDDGLYLGHLESNLKLPKKRKVATGFTMIRGKSHLLSSPHPADCRSAPLTALFTLMLLLLMLVVATILQRVAVYFVCMVEDLLLVGVPSSRLMIGLVSFFSFHKTRRSFWNVLIWHSSAYSLLYIRLERTSIPQRKKKFGAMVQSTIYKHGELKKEAAAVGIQRICFYLKM